MAVRPDFFPGKPIDAAIDATGCALAPDLGALNYKNASPLDFIGTDRTGPFAGRTIFSLFGALPGSTSTRKDVLYVEYVKPLTGGFELNAAINFDPDPNAAPYVAASFILGDFDTMTMTVGAYHYANSGALTLSEIGETSGATIKGSVATTTYREIDATNAEVSGGCTTSMTALTFDATHDGMNVAALQPLTADERDAIRRWRRR